jgi:hypothetical protein
MAEAEYLAIYCCAGLPKEKYIGKSLRIHVQPDVPQQHASVAWRKAHARMSPPAMYRCAVIGTSRMGAFIDNVRHSYGQHMNGHPNHRLYGASWYTVHTAVYGFTSSVFLAYFPVLLQQARRGEGVLLCVGLAFSQREPPISLARALLRRRSPWSRSLPMTHGSRSVVRRTPVHSCCVILISLDEPAMCRMVASCCAGTAKLLCI